MAFFRGSRGSIIIVTYSPTIFMIAYGYTFNINIYDYQTNIIAVGLLCRYKCSPCETTIYKIIIIVGAR